jgi:hypothetical protein
MKVEAVLEQQKLRNEVELANDILDILFMPRDAAGWRRRL